MNNTFDAPMMSTNGANVFMTEDGIHVHHPTLSREEVQENVAKILNWVSGPGQKLLISQTRLPFSFEEADEIRKAHEQFEFKCMQALAMYAQLREPKDLDFTTSDSLDRMEQVVKGFMQSLQKRRNVVVACYTFFRLVSELRELSQSPDQLAEMLEAANDVESVDRCLSRLNNTLRSLDTKSGLLSREGERVRVLVEQLPVIQAVERAVDDSRRRVAATSEHLKLRVLETKKRRQVLTCEHDAQQANSWLAEMCERLVASYRSDCVGMTPVESAARLDAHKKLEAKAAETHEYCKQLSQALSLMYRAAGSPMDHVDVFVSDTASLWRRLTRLLQETRERLEVADAFYRSVDILLSRVEQLLILISRDLDSGVSLKQVRVKYGRHRDELLGEFEDTKNVGVALIERIQLPMDEQNPMEGAECIERTNNVIKMKLYTLWLKIREFLMLLGQKIEITAWIERWAVIQIQIERIYELMMRLEEHWGMPERWPRTVADAEDAVAEHRRSSADVNRLFDQVLRDLDPLISRPEGEKGSSEDEAVRTAAMDAVTQLRDRKGDWDGRWHAHKDLLDTRLEMLILMSDLEKEVDMRQELLEQCKKRPLGEEQPVRECESQVGHWLQDLPDLRRRINEFFGRLKQEVGDDFEEDEARLRGKWSSYEHQVDLFRWIVDVALEILGYYSRANSELRSFSTQLPHAQSLSEIDGMLQHLAALIAEGRQLVSPVELKKASRDLYGSEEPVLPLLDRLDSVTVAITAMIDDANALKSGAEEDAIQMTSVHAVHSARPMLSMNAKQPAAGGDFELEVAFSGLGDAPEASWFKNGRPWTLRPPWRETWDEGLVRLRKQAIRPEDAGLYTCALESRGARAEGSFEVQVREPPQFLRHLEDNPAFVEGDPVLLQCQVSGNPEPSCQWFHDGRPIHSDRSDLLIDNGDGVCAIKIPHIMPRHAGLYECRISNPAGEAVERCRVDVHDEDPGADDSESVASRVTLESGPDEPKSVPDLAKAFGNEKDDDPDIRSFESPVFRGRAGPLETRPQRLSDDLPDDQKRSWTFYRDVPPRKPENVPNIFTDRREKISRSSPQVMSPEPSPLMKESNEWPALPPEIDPHFGLSPREPYAFSPISPRSPREEKQMPLRQSSYENDKPTKVSARAAMFESPGQLPNTEKTPSINDDDDSSLSSMIAIDTESSIDLENVWRPAKMSEDSLDERPVDRERILSSSSDEPDELFVRPETCTRPTLKDAMPPAQEWSENEPLVLDVTFDGSPSPEVTWYKDGRVLMDRPRSKIMTGPNSSTLTINPATSADAGLYAAVIKNQMGSQRSTSQVSIRPAGFAPTLIRQSSLQQTAREGEPVTFEFILSAEPACEVRWMKGNREIRPSPDFAVDSPEHGVHRLCIAKAYLEDSGQYRACATNPLGAKEVPFELLVDREEIDEDHISARSAANQRQGPPPPKSYSDESPTPCPPRLTDQMDETQICNPGDRVFLRCRLTGHPAPQVTWKKDGKKINSSDSHQPNKDQGIQISNFDDEYRLVIPEAMPSDSGVYTLTAANSLGSATTECDLQISGTEADQMRTTLIFHNTVVKSPPEFTQLFRDEICKVGDTVVLECQIVGLPPPTVWWSFNGEMMDETRCQFKNTGDKYSLVIPNVWLEDSGRYSVTAENSSGVATCSSLVIVEEHGRTGLMDRSNFSRSSSRPLSPVLAMPLPAHSQLSQLAPAASIERVRTVEVSPKRAGKYDFDNPPKLIVDRFQNSGPVPSAGVITASQATRQHSAAPARLPSPSSFKPKDAKPRVQIIRDTDAKDSSASSSGAGRRQFGKTGSGVRIVREYDNAKSASFPRNPNFAAKVTVEAPPKGDEAQRFSMVESSEYDSD